MSQLWLKLTPFSTDSSGFLSVLYGLDALMLSFDPQGCTNNYKNIDEPRWKDKEQRFYSAKITERELILGKEYILIEQGIKLIEKERPNFFVFMGGPISFIIGTDLIALAHEIEIRTGIKSIGISFKGQGFYDEGASLAMVTLAKEFLKPSPIKLKNSVNILGATVFEFPNKTDYENLLTLASKDHEVLTTWGISSPFEKLKKAPSAELNLVVSISGLALAKYMEENFDIPYKIFTPIGGLEKERHFNPIDKAVDKKILIIGEQLMANGLREYLKDVFGIKNIQVASFFMMEKSLMKTGDKKLLSEEDLEELLVKEKYHIIIGDTLFKRLSPTHMETRFIELPHIPVSSRFFLHQLINPYSKGIDDWIRRHLEEVI